MTHQKIRLGCIADDFTGATDLASNLVRSGMRVIQTIGVPISPLDDGIDAVVISLKSRTVAAKDAVGQSLAALHWLKAHDARQIYFKYCSTFDSTSLGNIGPVTDALMTALDSDFTIACPAFPETGRTVFKGYLFVGDELLQESGMRNHPLTPMTDSNLVRVLQSQTTRRVGLIDLATVRAGADAVRHRIEALRKDAVSIAVVDATDNADLITLGRSLASMPLVTAGSGVAIGLPQNFSIFPGDPAAKLPEVTGLRAIVSGSCSVATNAQVADFIGRGGASFAIDPLRLADGEDLVSQVLTQASGSLRHGTFLVYATAEPAAVRQVQARLGTENAGQIVEDALAKIARGLVEQGVRQLVVAGGETSGACVQALGIQRLRIGPQISPGVPWCHASTVSDADIHIALKSGNFGGADFFTSAFAMLS